MLGVADPIPAAKLLRLGLRPGVGALAANAAFESRRCVDVAHGLTGERASVGLASAHSGLSGLDDRTGAVGHVELVEDV